MKKLNFSLFLLLLISLPAGLFSQTCNGFFDGFESGTWLPNWDSVSTSYTRAVTTTNPASGTYAFQHTGTSGHMGGSYTTFTSQQPTYMSWSMKASTMSTTTGYVVVGDVNITTDYGIIFCYFSSAGGLRFYADGSNNFTYPTTANTWYDVEVKDIDWINRHSDIWINGTLIQSNFPFRSATASSVDRIHIYNLTSATTYYDDFQVGMADPMLTSSVLTDPTCFGDTSGTIDVGYSSASTPLSYSWSTGDTTEDITGVGAGSYFLSVTDTNGCQALDTFMLSSPPVITFMDSLVHPLCYGDSTGSIFQSVSGGNGGFVYNWTTGDTTKDISGLPAGTYVLNVADSLGCAAADTVQINSPSALMVMDSLVMPACNGDSSGMIDLTVSGATPGYSFNWSTGDMTEDIMNLSAGQYTVVILDTMGCMTTDTFTLNQPAPLILNGLVTPDNGSANGAIDLTPSGGTSPYTFVWSNSALTEDINGLTAGDYSVIVTDSNGCTATDTFTVSLITSVDGSLEESLLSVYPNPFTDEFSISFSGSAAVNLMLTDIYGRTVWTGQTQGGTTEVDENLSSGVYFLTAVLGEEKVVIRIIKH